MNAVSLAIPKAAPVSINHQHILSVINTEKPGARILDAGCGNGDLMSYLSSAGHKVSGFDVSDGGFLQSPNTTLISQCDPWPADNGSVDCVVSNQVLEHVRDIDYFFSENFRVLREGGIAVHLFPLKTIIWEPHIKQPLTHRFLNFDSAALYASCLARLGIGAADIRRDLGANGFGLDAANSLLHCCFYRSYKEVIRAARHAGLRPSLRYSVDYYFAKARSIAGLSPRLSYRRRTLETISARILSRLGSLTVFLEKRNTLRHLTR